MGSLTRKPARRRHKLRLAALAPAHEGKLALFALKARHDLRLALIDGCVKARTEQRILRTFPGRFDPEKWRDVLEQMHVLAGSLERGANLPQPSTFTLRT